MKRLAQLMALVPLLFGCGGPGEPPGHAGTRAPTTTTTGRATPFIVVDNARVTLDGVKVADARSVEGGGRLTRLDELFSQLKERREAWKREHPGASPPAEQWLDARAAGSVSAMSALMTAAFAGYRNVHFKTDSGWVEGQYDLPGPPSDGKIHARVAVQLGADEVGLVWQSDRPCDGVPENQRLPRPRMGDSLDGTCAKLGEPCIDATRIAFGSRVPFADVVATLGAIRRHAGAGFTFVLTRMDEDPMTKVPERVCGRPIPRSVVNGRLPPEEIQKIVRAGFPRLRACYEQGLARDPKLAGKVIVKMVINREGRVENASLVESPEQNVELPPGFGLRGGTKNEPQVTTLHNNQVTSCMLDGFRGLAFPKPEGGIVRRRP